MPRPEDLEPTLKKPAASSSATTSEATLSADDTNGKNGAGSSGSSEEELSDAESGEEEDDDEEEEEEEEEAEPEPEEDPVVVAERYKEEGNVQFKQQRYGNAIDLYTKAHQLNDKEPTYLTNRASSYMALKRYKVALEDCQAAAHLQRANPQSKTLLRLARCQLALGQPSQTRTTIATILDLEPNNMQAIQLRQKAASLEDHLEKYKRAAQNGEWVMARVALENAEKIVDGSIPVEWRCWKIEIEIRRRRWDSATSAATDALRLEPSSPEVLTIRALVLFLTNQIPSSIQHLQNALRLDPEYSRARLLLRRAREIEKLKEEGNVAFKGARNAEAVNKYTATLEAIGQKPEEGEGGQIYALVLNNRASALLKLERYDEAMDDVNLSLNLHPDYFKTLRTRARIHLDKEEYQEAIEDFKLALESSMVEGSAAEQKALEREIQKAEVALKRSKGKDYYKILKLKKDCTELEIKKAYRRESLIHHPDKGGDEEKFKLVVEAHAVLSDPQRRARYDSGADEDGQMGEGGGMGGGMGGMSQADLAAMFGAFGGGGGMGGMGGGSPFGGGRGGGFHGGGFGF
ncbi:TPR-like protein [Clavulina sp. PMI_390]|nr:TPR-like protein [Clavulina sp. PMI_390]